MSGDRNECGQTLVEVLITAAILGILALITLPALHTMMGRNALSLAAVRIQGLLVGTREEAIALERNRAVKFVRSGERWSYLIYEDGDGDGVLNADIDAGVDPLVRGPEDLGPETASRIGIPAEGIPDPDTGALLPAGSPPIHFNRSTLCSFSKSGSGTPGTVYIHARGGGVAMVRCSGEDGRIRTMFLRGKKWILQ